MNNTWSPGCIDRWLPSAVVGLESEGLQTLAPQPNHGALDAQPLRDACLPAHIRNLLG